MYIKRYFIVGYLKWLFKVESYSEFLLDWMGFDRERGFNREGAW